MIGLRDNQINFFGPRPPGSLHWTMITDSALLTLCQKINTVYLKKRIPTFLGLSVESCLWALAMQTLHHDNLLTSIFAGRSSQ